MDLALDGRTALVTGSDTRTGEIIANTLAAEGATVVYHGNHLAPEVNAPNMSLCGDVTTEEGCQKVVDELAEHKISIDILVNNYGTTDNHKWRNADTAKWLEMMQINLLSAVRLSQALTPVMKAKGWGRVINLSTIGSNQPAAERPAYYAAKAALANMGVSLMQELAGSGITVNTVSPGLIRTEQVEKAFIAKAKREGWPKDWPSIEQKVVETLFPNASGRLAEREEIADFVAFLCSPKAGFINGQNIRVDGGAVVYV